MKQLNQSSWNVCHVFAGPMLTGFSSDSTVATLWPYRCYSLTLRMFPSDPTDATLWLYGCYPLTLGMLPTDFMDATLWPYECYVCYPLTILMLPVDPTNAPLWHECYPTTLGMLPYDSTTLLFSIGLPPLVYRFLKSKRWCRLGKMGFILFICPIKKHSKRVYF